MLGLDLAAAGIRLLSYDESGALLEILPPEAGITAEEREGRLEYAIAMRAYSSTRVLGRPEVPTKRILLVTPDILEARSTLIETDSRTLPRLLVSRTRAPGIVPASTASAAASFAAREPSLEEVLNGAQKDLNARIRAARRDLMEARRRARLKLLGIEEDKPGRDESAGPGAGGSEGPRAGGSPDAGPPEPPAVDRSDVFPGDVIGLDRLLDYGGRQLLPIDINPVQVFGGAEVDVYRRILVRIDFLGRRERDPSESRAEQFRLAADPSALKLVVSSDGIYRLGHAELQAAGLDVSADPRTIRLFHLGREVAIRVEGEIDGVFGPQDEVLFLGTRNPWRTSDNPEAARYTDRNVYWLTSGSGFGKRMREAWVQPVDEALPAADRWASIHVESNAMFFPRLAGGDDVDRWFGAERLFNTPGGSHPLWRVTFPIALADLSNVPHDARVEVLLGGVTDFPGADPDHRVVVAVNGQDVGEARWAGFAGYRSAFEFPSALLLPGANEVELRVPADLAGIAYDSVLVNFVRLEYRARFAAAGDRLEFGGDVPGQYEAAGFASPEVVGLEATDPLAPLFLRGLAVDAGTVRFNDVSSGGGGVFSLAGRGALRSVDQILANESSAWNDGETRADWVAIAAPELLEGVHPLADHRRARGHETAVADLVDVYDEFSGGIPDPSAIRDFLAHARAAWALPPRFCLLVGDGSFDPQGYSGAEPDLLPARLIQMEYLASASDNWFAAVEGDDILPDLAIGRFPVRDLDGLAVVVAKTIAHDLAAPGAWHGRATLVADGDDTAYDFSVATALFAARFPPELDLEILDLGQIGQNATRAGIRTAFDEGRLLVGYMGHGSTAQWANENVLDVAGAASLAPTGRTGLVTAMGCMNGMFHLPSATSLGEALLNVPEAGAAAFWGSSSLVDPLGQEIVYRELLSLLFDEPRGLTIGEAINEAKVRAWTDAGDQDDVVKSWILLGDPALRLRFPE